MSMTAEAFRDWRQTMGWTQGKAAQEFSRSRATIVSWETGQQKIPEGIDEVCQWKARMARQHPDFGPVTLVWANGPMWIDAYSPKAPTVVLQAFKSNRDAIEFARKRLAASDFQDPFVTCSDPKDGRSAYGVYDPTEFRLACEKLVSIQQSS